jgi:hypothetical protein
LCANFSFCFSTASCFKRERIWWFRFHRGTPDTAASSDLKDPADKQLSKPGVAVGAIVSGFAMAATAAVSGSNPPVDSDPPVAETASMPPLAAATSGAAQRDWATPPTSPVAGRIQHPAVSYHEESERQPRKTGVSTLNLN